MISLHNCCNKLNPTHAVLAWMKPETCGFLPASNGRKSYSLGLTYHQSEQKFTSDFHLMGSGSAHAFHEAKCKGNKTALVFPECKANG